MSFFRRRPPVVPRIAGRAPADYGPELQEFLQAILDMQEGLPAGAADVVTIGAGTGDSSPNNGWIPAGAAIATAAPSVAITLGGGATEGVGEELIRFDATFNTQILLAQVRNEALVA